MERDIRHVVISGGSGTLGQAILRQLPDSVDCITLLSRSERAHEGERVRYSQWDPARGEIDDEVLATADAIINLAGANVGQPWTEAHKKAIVQSRLDSTGVLVEAIKRHPRIRVMVNASAIGIYPDSTEIQSVDSKGDDSFISHVVQKWEGAWNGLSPDQARTCGLRIGLVLSNESGFFKKLKPLFKLGLGAALGNGKQLVSWIHEDDVARMFVFALYDTEAKGIFNAVAPQVLTNQQFSKNMAHAMGKKLFPINVPAFALKLVMGEMSQVALRSVGVKPEGMERLGFQFEYLTVEDAVGALTRQ